MQILRLSILQLKFAYRNSLSLDPENCILAGASGTHTVCVCVHHENVNLILDAVDLKEPTCKYFSPIKTYHDAMNRIMCSTHFVVFFLITI